MATLTCIITDLFTLGSGLCSLFHQMVNVEYGKFQTITERMSESVNNFDQAIKVAIGILTEEIELISIWNKSAKVVNKNIDEYPAEYLRQYKSVRNIFISGLDDLKNAANKFLEQTKDILKLE